MEKLTNNEKRNKIIKIIIAWIIVWSILELIIPGPILKTSLMLYIGTILGYSLSYFDDFCKEK